MAKLKIKNEFKNVRVGFNNSSEPLGKRSQADLAFLHESAKRRNDTDWLNWFETEDVSQKEIDEVKAEAFTEKQSRKRKKE